MSNEKCPTCESPAKHLHPAVQADGGEVHLCKDAWHGPLDPRMTRSGPPYTVTVGQSTFTRASGDMVSIPYEAPAAALVERAKPEPLTLRDALGWLHQRLGEYPDPLNFDLHGDRWTEGYDAAIGAAQILIDAVRRDKLCPCCGLQEHRANKPGVSLAKLLKRDPPAVADRATAPAPLEEAIQQLIDQWYAMVYNAFEAGPIAGDEIGHASRWEAVDMCRKELEAALRAVPSRRDSKS